MHMGQRAHYKAPSQFTGLQMYLPFPHPVSFVAWKRTIEPVRKEKELTEEQGWTKSGMTTDYGLQAYN